MAGQQKPTGSLTIRLIEALGTTEDDAPLWDDSFLQGFVKVELRGPTRHVKAASTLQNVSDGCIDWNEDLKLEVLEDANELRIMLCKERRTQHRKGADVIAACGLFVGPLLAAVPINKLFDMYKPGNAGPGGSIRIHADFKKFEEDKNWDTHPGHLPALAEESGGDSARRSEAADNEGMQPPTPTKGEAAGDEAASTEPLHERPLDISRATSAFHGSIGVEHPSPPARPPPAHGPSRQKAVAQASGQNPPEESSKTAPTAPGPRGNADKAPAGSPPSPAPSAAKPPTTGGSKGGGSAEGSRGGADVGDSKGGATAAAGAADAPGSSPGARAQQAGKASGAARERSSPTRQRLDSPSRRRPSNKRGGGPMKLFAAAAIATAVMVVAKQVSARHS